MKHRNDIDGLRAVAVMPVILFHFGLGFISGGFTGVDIFFVISGFVIAQSILADIRSGKFSIVNFYFKRARRILPAFTAMIVLTSIAAAFILLPEDLLDYSKSVIFSSSFLSNLYFWKSSGYFAAAAQTKPLLHTWSLSIEEQYYLFAPIAFYLIHRFGRERWLLVILPALFLSLAVSIFAVFAAPTAGFFLLPTRAWELLLGASLVFFNGRIFQQQGFQQSASLIGMGLIAYGMIFLTEQDPFPGWNALFPCVGAALIILAGVRKAETGLATNTSLPLINRLLSTRPFVWIGLISYSLYLVHWPISALTRYVSLREPTAIEALIMLIASLALAWLSWRFIEQPFRHIELSKRRLVLGASAVVIAFCIMIGLGGVALKGLPTRFPDLVEMKIAGTEDWGGDSCFNQNPAKATPWDASTCRRIQGDNGRILVWGDSFAAQYMPGILRDAKRINADVLQYTFAGCPPILAYFSYARVACHPFNQNALTVIKEQRIDTVVLAGRWVDTPKRTLQQLGDTVKTLQDMGLRVYVFGQSPQFATDVQHIDYISGARMSAGEASWITAINPKLNKMVEAQSQGATYINPIPYLCAGQDEDQKCPYRQDGTYYYADYGHFSTDGSLRAVKDYFPSGQKQ